MGIYKEIDGTAEKCCDVGGGCSWTGCNHSRLSDADYRAWKARQRKSDEKYKGKGRNRTDVGPYRWAVCSQCIRQSRAKGIHITMRDGFVLQPRISVEQFAKWRSAFDGWVANYQSRKLVSAAKLKERKLIC